METLGFPVACFLFLASTKMLLTIVRGLSCQNAVVFIDDFHLDEFYSAGGNGEWLDDHVLDGKSVVGLKRVDVFVDEDTGV